MKKKVLVWAPFIKKVGTTTNVLNSLEAFKRYSKNKYEITLINVFGEWDNYLNENKYISKIDLFRSNFILNANTNGFLRSRFYTTLIFLRSIIPLINLIRKNDYEYILCHLVTSLPIFISIVLKKKIRIILNIAGYPKLNILRKTFWKLFKKSIYKVICPSDETKELIEKKKIFLADKLIKIEDPHINIRSFNKKRSELVPKDVLEEEYIVCIGRLTKQKNFLFLLNSFQSVLNMRPNIKLLIIGEGEQRKSIEDLIKKYNFKDKVYLYGYKENIYHYLKNASCYLSVSLWEGPDLAMLDAAYLNIPIICSDCPSGRKEFINEGEAGYIFKLNDKKSFLKEIESFFNEEKNVLKKKLVQAKKKVKNFTIFQYFTRIISIID